MRGTGDLRELEVFAYLYDGLHMSAELLEYVVEHCVQGGHTSIRYIETVAISWHEKGFATVEQAKAYASGFTKNSFSVMRAFGLTGRNPGETEREMIERWFGEYGFTKRWCWRPATVPWRLPTTQASAMRTKSFPTGERPAFTA